ncbi:hypothetical protein FHS83_003794 [Rhizomicrobium palustre]|uniref:Lipoprotein n=1 Tax=Rhizomicrobium palustre TaxID=189966 RepID=A0A846N419_9PROT|nr:hypothetical protein [Rhizomicrobium palustre]NIK90476.1 hypothetical protein [Rhizomicrobium palustre]
MVRAFAGVMLIGLLCAGCATEPAVTPPPKQQFATPRRVVEMAADAAPSGVLGIVDMTVRGTGIDDGYVYLNSEEDYRDQRNLSIAIPPQAVAAFKERFGAAPEDFFKGKHIHVRGMARRVKISFISNGRVTEKYYYLTHLTAGAPTQITLVP